jgi:hypothetical protein
MPEVEANPKVNIAPSPAPAPAAAPAKGERRFPGILIGVVALVVAAVAIWIGYKALSIGPMPSPNPAVVINNPQTTADIKNDSNFQQLEDQVNNTDLDSLTKDLDQNDTDASGF